MKITNQNNLITLKEINLNINSTDKKNLANKNINPIQTINSVRPNSIANKLNVQSKEEVLSQDRIDYLKESILNINIENLAESLVERLVGTNGDTPL